MSKMAVEWLEVVSKALKRVEERLGELNTRIECLEGVQNDILKHLGVDPHFVDSRPTSED